MSKDPKDELARELTGELFELSMALDLIGNASAGQIGINQTDLMCLNLLVRHGPMSPGQIAAALGLTTAAISAMASRLEAGGYAAREIDPKDRRRVLMHASPLGAERAFGLFDDFFLATTELFGSTSEDDLRRLADLLQRFRHLLTEHAQAIRDRPK
ncbi:MarR family winged helix-turn-helix transcriptional regulator [Nonomuraea endophytica]|uniref:DNA-binding MarR family transcriptional regulator n=1 Tax=Nonomuraea endophytica TaxID=714136 RepID=A0A7W8A5I1_9ACTN|nr:MarR family transcriptional regulator [Nonomuraea endophytica]MBB5079235.1 DNA-binding MarR family transcriptional regulator [Nonomuraea endophytica]